MSTLDHTAYTIYYIHGYQSNPNSGKGVLFKETLNAEPIRYRTCEPEQLRIPKCLDNIHQVIKHDPHPILIGSSLGGFLAAKTAQTHPQVAKLILLNPAIIPPSQDLKSIPDMPQQILKDMQDPTLYSQELTLPLLIIRGTDDTVVRDQWVIPFAQHHQATLIFLHDDHRFTRNLTQLPQYIQQFITQ